MLSCFRYHNHSECCDIFGKIKVVLLAVGTFLGAMTGAFIGQETESGFIRGAAVGAMSGAVFSIEVFEYSLDLWRSNESGIDCLLYLVSHFLKSLSIINNSYYICCRRVLIVSDVTLVFCDTNVYCIYAD